ncbi:AAA family ATPase, partial [Paucilactobacillus nenjiangensis]
MRITEIQIDGFGKWQSTNFELSPELQIFFGSNESGKSTLTQFIISVIFGFQNHLGKNKYLQYIPKNTASYGGVIVFEHQGETYRLKRTKGKKVAGKIEFSTLDGEKLTEDELNEVLTPMNETLFRTLFSFSQTDLNQIFDLSKNDIDAALQQMGTVGSSQWLDLAKNFDKSAGQIYKDGGQVPTLNVKLNQRQELINKINNAKQDYNRYHQLIIDNDNDMVEQVKIVDQLAEIRKQEQQLDQLNRLMPIFEKLKTNETNEAIKFTSNDEIEVNQSEIQINELQNGITQNQTQLKVINDKKFTSAKQQFYFDHLADFDAAYREIPTVKQAVSSREQLMDEIQRVSNAVNEIKAKYGQVPE